MEWADFQKEMARLKNQWPSAYESEREALIFKAFRRSDTQTFRDAVSICLTSCRQAPLMDELTKAVESSRGRILNFKSGYDTATNALLATPTGASDPEFVAASKQTLSKYQRGELNKAQFLQACDYLDATAIEFQKNRGVNICRACSGSGLVYTENAENYRSVWRCTCRLGEGHSQQIPVFQPQIKLTPGPSGRDRQLGRDE